MVKKKNRREKKEIIAYIQEQMNCLEDAFEPSISKSLEHIKDKFELGNIHFEFRIAWKMKVNYNK